MTMRRGKGSGAGIGTGKGGGEARKTNLVRWSPQRRMSDVDLCADARFAQHQFPAPEYGFSECTGPAIHFSSGGGTVTGQPKPMRSATRGPEKEGRGENRNPAIPGFLSHGVIRGQYIACTTMWTRGGGPRKELESAGGRQRGRGMRTSISDQVHQLETQGVDCRYKRPRRERRQKFGTIPRAGNLLCILRASSHPSAQWQRQANGDDSERGNCLGRWMRWAGTRRARRGSQSGGQREGRPAADEGGSREGFDAARSNSHNCQTFTQFGRGGAPEV
ncbi:hypothetical protein C8R46DRAFT_1039731 [Mycena filopes]|nr:hypothetical protein C8R46DRAFT_1039731 [Mycena filopes]